MTNVFDRLQKEIKKGNVVALKNFIGEGGDPDLSNRFGWTLLMVAAIYGNTVVIKHLLNNGAKVNIKNKFGESALSCAVISGHLKAAELLLTFGASVVVKPRGVSLLESIKNNVPPTSKIFTILWKAGAK